MKINKQHFQWIINIIINNVKQFIFCAIAFNLTRKVWNRRAMKRTLCLFAIFFIAVSNGAEDDSFAGGFLSGEKSLANILVSFSQFWKP